MGLAGCSPVPSERRKWFQRKKTMFSELASDFVPSLAVVKSLLKPRSANALPNLLAQSWSRENDGESQRSPQPRGVWRKPWAACRPAGAPALSAPCPAPWQSFPRGGGEPADMPFYPKLSQAMDTSKKGLKCLPVEPYLTCHGLHLTTIFLPYEHQPS